MDFTEFRDKYSISQDKLHKLTLEAFDLFLSIENERQELIDECLERGLRPEDYEYEPGSARDEYLHGFLQLLMDNEDGE